MAAVTALWPVAAWRSPWQIIPFQCFSYHYCPSHRNTNVYMALGNIPLELKPHPLCVGYVTSLVICLWLIICCTRLGAHKPNWVSCSFCHILLMMISVLYFLRYCQYSCLFFSNWLVLPDHFMLMESDSMAQWLLVIFVSGSDPWPDGSQSPLPETLLALNEENMKNTLLGVPWIINALIHVNKDEMIFGYMCISMGWCGGTWLQCDSIGVTSSLH